MSVVIDELEVVVDDAAPAPSGEAGAAPPAPPQPSAPGLEPEDVRFLVDRRACRAARLYAH